MFATRLLLYTFTLLFFTYECVAENGTNYVIVPFEYGSHVPGEELSLLQKGFIPPFVPLHTVNVTHLRDDCEQRYTYLRVEYLSPMSSVNIVYDPDTVTLTFHVMFPFMNIPYGIIGYSMKLRDKPSQKPSESSRYS